MPNRPLADEDLIGKFTDCLAFVGRDYEAPDLHNFEISKLAGQAFNLTT